jgi:hypothetical protein
MGKGNGEGNGIVKQTPGGDNIACAVALQLHKQMSEADLDKEGQLEQVYLEPEAWPAVSISADDDTDSTESDSKYDSVRDSDVDMRMDDDVDAQDSVDLDGDVDMDRDGEDEEDDEKEDQKDEVVVDKAEKEDEDKDNDNEPQTIRQREMLNMSADDSDTMEDDQATMLPEQGQEMHEHTPQLRPPADATWPQTRNLCPRPRTPETHKIRVLEFLGLVTPQKLYPES